MLSTKTLTFRRFLSQAQLKVATSSWKADSDDPLQHNINHEAKLYSLSDAAIEKAFVVSPFEKEMTRFFKAVNQTSIMIRKPALDIIHHLKELDYSKPTTRFALYGDFGQGKSFTLVHLVHYLHQRQDSLILYLPQPAKIFKYPTDQCESTSRPGRLDLPIDSAYWLQRFKLQNESLLNKLDEQTRCTQDYTWSLREVSKKGDSLMSVIDHGVSRAKHASDCIAVLLKELKQAAESGTVKLSLVVENMAWFVADKSELRHSDRKVALIDDITITRAFKKLLRNDWNGGVVIGTIEDIKERLTRHQTPESVLDGEGLRFFRPFVSVHVPKYNLEEFENIMNYYQSIEWLQRPVSQTREARDELRFVSGLNPRDVFMRCRAL